MSELSLNGLFVLGAIFPAISLITSVGCVIQWRFFKKRESAILIPLIGPVFLTAWAISGQRPIWVIPLCWLTDIGTLAFLPAYPRLTREWWETSRFTRFLALRGSEGIQSARLTLHTGGNYLLVKKWRRLEGEIGILELGDFGSFVRTEAGFELTSHFGMRRELRRAQGESYLVVEAPEQSAEYPNYSLNGWSLAVVSG